MFLLFNPLLPGTFSRSLFVAELRVAFVEVLILQIILCITLVIRVLYLVPCKLQILHLDTYSGVGRFLASEDIVGVSCWGRWNWVSG